MGTFDTNNNDTARRASADKCRPLLEDISKKPSFVLLELEEASINPFEELYSQYNDRMFYSVAVNCGGIIHDNWIRLFGSGKLNIVEKNSLFNCREMDIVIGEDVIGGVFALKDNIVYYFAPDSLEWECLDASYIEFMSLLIHFGDRVDQFYENNRWSSWREDAGGLDISEGFSIYPFLFAEKDLPVDKRSIKVVPINEIHKLNLELRKKLL